MPDISIIIPVYNAEKYLKKCLDSVILALGKTKGEIVAVDNNSSDNSLAILKEYAKKYPEIISIKKCSTPGSSAARNFGVKKAKGKYIWFIDADDRIDKTAIDKLLKKAKEGDADLVMTGAGRKNFEGESSYLPAINASDVGFKSKFVRYGMGPWQVLIRRSWWKKHKFSFREGIIHEDMELMSSLILFTDKFASVDEPLYFYDAHPDSVLHQEVFNPHIFDIFPALTGLYDKFRAAKAEKKYHDELEWFFIWNLLIDSAKDFSKFKEGRPGFRRARELLKKYFPNWRKNRFLKQKPLKLRMRVLLNYYK